MLISGLKINTFEGILLNPQKMLSVFRFHRFTSFYHHFSSKVVIFIDCRVFLFMYSLTRVGLVLLFLQYLSELGFHIARLLYFTDENHQKM